MSSPLAGALSQAGDTGLRKKIAKVRTTSPLILTTSNGDIPATGRLSSYAPVIGDVVLMLVDDGGAAIVAGKVLPA